MRFKNNFFYNYLLYAPVPLAIERSIECEIMSKHEFKEPVLDIGCGDGLFVSILFNQEINTGVETDNKEIQLASRYGLYQELINCGGSGIPKDNESYQTIFSNSVLEHIPDVESVLKEANRLLVPGGNFYATVPTNFFDKYTFGSQILTFFRCKGLARQYQKLFNRFWKHYHCYEKEKWEALFQSNGFKIVESIEYCPKIVCLIESFFVPFSFFSFLAKRIFNKWIVLPGVRIVFIYPLYLLLKSLVRESYPVPSGGIVFFHLSK